VDDGRTRNGQEGACVSIAAGSAATPRAPRQVPGGRKAPMIASNRIDACLSPSGPGVPSEA